MKLVFYSIVLNHHQAPLADALYDILGDDYIFVETSNLNDKKGATEDFSTRPYLLNVARDAANYQKAMFLAETADCCVFSGVEALPFQKVRMRKDLLSFDMSERWLKRGIFNIFSPTILKMLVSYYCGNWGNKRIYKLCCSAFAKHDQLLLGTYINKCFKWGYFTQTSNIDATITSHKIIPEVVTIMWCSRFLDWKHPELPIFLAHRLKTKGYRFIINMYGSGEFEESSKQLVKKLNLDDVVQFKGIKPNHELMSDMRNHSIFLFTSDQKEGWGAVANESMNNGCVLVASDKIGSAPYLIKEGKTGFLFISPRISCRFNNPDMQALDSLCSKIEWLLNHPTDIIEIQQRSRLLIQNEWAPQIAAKRLLTLIKHLNENRESPFADGPCSKA